MTIRQPGLVLTLGAAATAAEAAPAATAASSLIGLSGVTKTYDAGELAVQALRGIDLAIEKGQMVAIIGPSGSGKSTLMHILGCLDAPSTGHLRPRRPGRLVAVVASSSPAVRNRKIGFVFQTFNLLPKASLLRNVELPHALRRASAAPTREERAAEALAPGGPRRAGEAQARPSSPGGQRQRAAIARAIVMEPVPDPGRRAHRQPRQQDRGRDPPDLPRDARARRDHRDRHPRPADRRAVPARRADRGRRRSKTTADERLADEEAPRLALGIGGRRGGRHQQPPQPQPPPARGDRPRRRLGGRHLRPHRRRASAR